MFVIKAKQEIDSVLVEQQLRARFPLVFIAGAFPRIAPGMNICTSFKSNIMVWIVFHSQLTQPRSFLSRSCKGVDYLLLRTITFAPFSKSNNAVERR